MNKLYAALKALAMLGLQSDRYTTDAAYRKAVDDGIELTRDVRYSIRLQSPGPNMVQVVKELRNHLKIGLSDGVHIVKHTPIDVAVGMDFIQAGEFVSKLRAVGAIAGMVAES